MVAGPTLLGPVAAAGVVEEISGGAGEGTEGADWAGVQGEGAEVPGVEDPHQVPSCSCLGCSTSELKVMFTSVSCCALPGGFQ